jgi:phenylacetate-CoA ligase
MTVEIPYYHRSLDWERFIADYPPPPMYEKTAGRLSSEAMHALQERRFLERVGEGWKTPFYSSRWRSVGLEPGDIASLADITKIPTFTSDDLKEAIAAAPPFGDHHPLGRDQFGGMLLKIQTSGGTTGKARPILFDPVAWEVYGVQGARSLYAAGARPGDVIQVPYTNALGSGPWNGYTSIFNWGGCVPLTTGSGVVTASELQLRYALEFGTRGWWIAGEYAGRLIDVASSMNFDLHQLRTRYLCLALGADVDGQFRRQLQDAWAAPVYDRYGSHEVGLVSFDCAFQNGMHVNEDTVYLEILDPDSGQIAAAGERGEVVATSLHRSVPPFIRYNVRDLMKLYPRQSCECGLQSQKLSVHLGRSDEMVKLRGQNLYPRACQPIVAADPRTNGQYLCVASNVGEGVSRRTEVVVQIERVSLDVDNEALAVDLRRALHSGLGVRVEVDVVDPGTLAEATGVGQLGERKIRRLLDLRRAPGQ